MAKFDDLIPTKLLDNPVPIDAHWTSYGKFVRAVVPATAAGILAFALAILIWSLKGPFELMAVFALGGIFFLFINVYAVFVFEDERNDKQWRQNMYSQQLTIINLAITNMTVIQRATNVHVGTEAPKLAGPTYPQLLYPEIDTEVNAVYNVATVMVKLALRAWQANNNTRPKIKPISYDAVTKEIETGHARWKQALEMLEDAKILHNATQANWEPLLTDQNTALRLLDALIIARGFYKHMNNHQVEWRRAVPKEALQ